MAGRKQKENPMEKRKIYLGIFVVAAVILVLAVFYVGGNTAKVKESIAEPYCLEQKDNPYRYQLCITAFEHILDYIETHMGDVRIVGRRFRYVSDENIWLIGAYVIDESNNRQVVTYDPRSGEVVVSSPD